MLSGPRRRFCEGIVAGKSATDAYAEAYPRTGRSTARKHASRLMKDEGVKAEIARLRAQADAKAGSAVLTLMEKRMFLARLVRCNLRKLNEVDGDLFVSVKHTEAGTEYRIGCKLKAIEIDNDLAGEGSEAEGRDAFGEWLASLRN